VDEAQAEAAKIAEAALALKQRRDELELERERVLTDHHCTVQEDTMFCIKKAEGLIARAQTEELRQ
jgi:hypothetical protein